MKKILFVSKTRGFFDHLYKSKSEKISFSTKIQSYEKFTKKRKLLSAVGRSWLFDKLGYLQVLEANAESADIYATYNRFLKSDKPYVIYLENPTALFHYKLSRRNSYFGKKNLQNKLNDPNLKAIVCMSKATQIGFNKIYQELIIRKDLIIEQIYPLIPNVKLNIQEKKIDDKIKMLFIAQGNGFITKGGMEVVNAFDNLSLKYQNLELTIISSKAYIPDKIYKQIENSSNINFIEFGIEFEELKKIYITSDILLHLTRQDSFGMTILEAMKYGCAVLSTTLYSIPELIENEKNGFLTDPSYWFFDKNYLPNPKVWNNRKKTILKKETDVRIENFIFDKLSELRNNPYKLYLLQKESFKKANESFLSDTEILKKWEKLIDHV